MTAPAAAPPGFLHCTRTIRGVPMHSVEGGAGAPVLLVPGWPQSWYCWRHVMVPLARSHRVVAIDPPGLGDSAPAPGGSDTANVAASLMAIVEALGWTRFDFIGHDIGAWLGYAFAVRWPQHVRRLALIEALIPGLAPPGAMRLAPDVILRTWHFAFNALPELPELLVTGREREYLAWLFRTRSTVAGAIDAAALDEYVRVYSKPGGLAGGFDYYRSIFASTEQNRATAGEPLAMPVLAAGGEHWIGAAMATQLEPVARVLRGAVISGCAHFPPEERPAETIALLQAFLAA